MLLKKHLSPLRYVLLTIILICSCFYFLPKQSYLPVFILVASVIVNHALLVLVLYKMLFVSKELRDNTSIFLLFIAKFGVLIGAFYYVFTRAVINPFYLVAIYIFQLIILALSIKRYK